MPGGAGGTVTTHPRPSSQGWKGTSGLDDRADHATTREGDQAYVRGLLAGVGPAVTVPTRGGPAEMEN